MPKKKDADVKRKMLSYRITDDWNKRLSKVVSKIEVDEADFARRMLEAGIAAAETFNYNLVSPYRVVFVKIPTDNPELKTGLS